MTRWTCPGCSLPLATAAGLAFHLISEGPGIGEAACPAAQRERATGDARRPTTPLESYAEVAR